MNTANTIIVCLAIFMIISFCSCSGKDNASKDVVEEEFLEKESINHSATSSMVEEVTIKAFGNTMESIGFDKKLVTVQAGTRVRLTLINESEAENMYHNIVICTKGTAKIVGIAGAKAGAEKDYVPDHPIVLASSKMAAPGETIIFEFTAPEPGTYDFVCTYPGHWLKMQGQLIVK